MESESLKRITYLIKEYGFAIYDIYDWKELCFKIILSIFCIPFVPYAILLVLTLLSLGSHTHSELFMMETIKWGTIIAVSYIIYYMIGIIGAFILGSKMVYLKDSYIFAGVIFPDINLYHMESVLKKYFLIPLKWCYVGEEKKNIFNFNDPLWTGSFIFIVVVGSIFGYVGASQINELGLIWLLWLEIGLIGTCILITIIYRSFHPLYVFENLGEKIQKLTPQISEKSQEIQKQFASNMNYQNLSEGFDGLASTFSQIVSLVIRLEKVEQKANKGNLFDSEKYINSLRLDIIVPLCSLREFLETKRTELIRSQQELTRVRVEIGGGAENRDIQSARTEPLIIELTENIEKLDLMIGKME